MRGSWLYQMEITLLLSTKLIFYLRQYLKISLSPNWQKRTNFDHTSTNFVREKDIESCRIMLGIGCNYIKDKSWMLNSLRQKDDIIQKGNCMERKQICGGLVFNL